MGKDLYRDVAYQVSKLPKFYSLYSKSVITIAEHDGDGSF